MFSSFVSETRPKACKEWGSTRGAMGSKGPPFGIFILMRRCQLDQNEEEKRNQNFHLLKEKSNGQSCKVDVYMA